MSNTAQLTMGRRETRGYVGMQTRFNCNELHAAGDSYRGKGKAHERPLGGHPLLLLGLQFVVAGLIGAILVRN